LGGNASNSCISLRAVIPQAPFFHFVLPIAAYFAAYFAGWASSGRFDA
jgi:hypothetical protein